MSVEINYQLLAGSLSVGIGLINSAMYIRAILRGETKPHVFTWFIWGLLMSIAGAVAFVEGAVVSAGVLFVGGAVNAAICVLSIKNGDRDVTRSDWVMFLSALAVIPVWLTTKDPLFAALWVSLIDLLGCAPTYRKAWNRPYEENLAAFCTFTVTATLGLLAVSPLTFVTALYPALVLFINLTVALEVYFRRRALSPIEGV